MHYVVGVVFMWNVVVAVVGCVVVVVVDHHDIIIVVNSCGCFVIFVLGFGR